MIVADGPFMLQRETVELLENTLGYKVRILAVDTPERKSHKRKQRRERKSSDTTVAQIIWPSIAKQMRLHHVVETLPQHEVLRILRAAIQPLLRKKAVAFWKGGDAGTSCSDAERRI